uniref:Apple domain-containing protein n=1 Tax=Macrostomum lignano TaxID=282301 RepID=A0A1I8HKU9_9PLAT
VQGARCIQQLSTVRYWSPTLGKPRSASGNAFKNTDMTCRRRCTFDVVLAVCLTAAVAAEVVSSGVQFSAARTSSAVAPSEFLAPPEDSEINCGIVCSRRSVCFGFYWLLGACRLFDLQAFINANA